MLFPPLKSKQHWVYDDPSGIPEGPLTVSLPEPLRAPVELVKWVAENGRLPVVTFTAGGIATPADAALCMQLGADGVFVGSGIFKSGNPADRARAIVEATTHYLDADVLARVSAGLGEAMVGISTQTLDPSQLLETRGW